MTKSKTIAAAIAALTRRRHASPPSPARLRLPPLGPSRGWGLGAGIVAGSLIGAAAASNAYYDGYTECHFIRRYDRWGNPYRVKVCDVAPY